MGLNLIVLLFKLTKDCNVVQFAVISAVWTPYVCAPFKRFFQIAFCLLDSEQPAVEKWRKEIVEARFRVLLCRIIYYSLVLLVSAV
jgi:hypothetical protein